MSINVLARRHSSYPPSQTDYSLYENQYLTTKALGSGNITFTIPSDVNTYYITEVAYRKNGGEWTTTANSSSEVVITVSVVANDIIEWQGNGIGLCGGGSYTSASKFGGTVQFNVYGNAMSMLWSNNFIGQTQFPNTSRERVMQGLFYQSSVVDASGLVLPVTYLSNSHTYMGMFSGCTNLIYPPAELPEPDSTVVLNLTYIAMFDSCSSMIRCPDMKWEGVLGTCKNGTFYKMFYGCTALTGNIPNKIEVQNYTASTAGYQIFRMMFQGCTHITTIPSLIIHNNNSTITGTDDGPFYHAFYGCTSLVDLSNKTLAIENSTNTAGYEFYYTFAASTNIEKSPLISIPETHKCTFYRMFDGGTRKITDLYLDIDNIYTDGTNENSALYYMLVNTGNTNAGTSAWNNRQGQMLHLCGNITSITDFLLIYAIFGTDNYGWSPYWECDNHYLPLMTMAIRNLPNKIPEIYELYEDREKEQFIMNMTGVQDMQELTSDPYYCGLYKYFGDSVELENETYYIWYFYNDNDYNYTDSSWPWAVLTKVDDYATLYDASLESGYDIQDGYLGKDTKWIYGMITDDYTVYRNGRSMESNDYYLIKVERNN